MSNIYSYICFDTYSVKAVLCELSSKNNTAVMINRLYMISWKMKLSDLMSLNEPKTQTDTPFNDAYLIRRLYLTQVIDVSLYL